MLSQPARCSRRLECDVQEFGRCFPVLQALGDHTQGERLDSCDRFVPVSAVTHHAWERSHFSEPPAVILALEFDREGHEPNLPSGQPSKQPLPADGGRRDIEAALVALLV